MGRSRRRRSKPNQPVAKVAQTNMSPPIVSGAVDTSKQKGPARKVWGAWKEVWAILGPCIALTGFFFLLKPQVEIDPSVNLDPAEPLATQFLISNKGHVPVYNIQFGCFSFLFLILPA